MNVLNLGFGEIVFILVIALIIFGPGSLVKTAREAGVLIRKITKSPYWQEVWATRRELNDLPARIVKEANLEETIKDLDRETSHMKSSVANTVADLIREVDQPPVDMRHEIKADLMGDHGSDRSTPDLTQVAKKKK